MSWTEMFRLKSPLSLSFLANDDLFEPDVPICSILPALEQMQSANHPHLLITKHLERAAAVLSDYPVLEPANFWIGIEIKYQGDLINLEKIVACPCKKVGIFEPHAPFADLGREQIDALDWILIGGARGPKAQPADIATIKNVLQYSQEIPIYWRGWGEWTPISSILRMERHHAHRERRTINGETYLRSAACETIEDQYKQIPSEIRL